MQTKRNLDKDMLGEAFLRVKEVLLFPMHISINEKADYKVQDCQVSHGDLWRCCPPLCPCAWPEHLYGFCEDLFLPGLGHLTVDSVTDFSFKWVEPVKPVNKVKLGEPPTWIVYW